MEKETHVGGIGEVLQEALEVVMLSQCSEADGSDNVRFCHSNKSTYNLVDLYLLGTREGY